MKKIQIIFPGVGYHCDKPLLYYGRDIAVKAGYEKYINISYSCPVDRIRRDEAKMKIAFEAMYAQAEEQLKDVSWEEYTDILFVSKSIGTVIAATYDKKHFGGKVKHLFYTPLEYTFRALEGGQEIDAMAFIGSKDPWSDVPAVVELATNMNIPIHLYEGLNHSLESDDTESNIRILADVMVRSKNFLM